jgi:hypothetical protein
MNAEKKKYNRINYINKIVSAIELYLSEVMEVGELIQKIIIDNPSPEMHCNISVILNMSNPRFSVEQAFNIMDAKNKEHLKSAKIRAAGFRIVFRVTVDKGKSGELPIIDLRK